jgi:hypothetical protein
VPTVRVCSTFQPSRRHVGAFRPAHVHGDGPEPHGWWDYRREARRNAVSEDLNEVLEDAIWHALDDELGTPHSGVDMPLVVAGFLERLAAAGYAIVKTGESS